jgi:hypothetical protein
MSQRPISLSPDLKRLRDEGYDLEIRSGFLLVKHVPYVNCKKEIKRGTFVTKLILAGDVTAQPDDHVGYFDGEYPCHQDGKEIEPIRNQSSRRAIAEGVWIDHTFSAKPQPTGKYEDYYAKVTTYVVILSGPAQAIDKNVTAKTFPVIGPDGDDKNAIFKYIDTASSRAEITTVTEKLASVQKIAIVGLGGTGAYVLDLVAKTPVNEIHLFDGDTFFQHNAFRAPGAPSIDELRVRPSKVEYLAGIYSKMRKGVIPHPAYIDAGNIDELHDVTFVFLCLEGPVKQSIVERLESLGVSFIDVGMGVYLSEGSLGGILRVTTSTTKRRDHVRGKVSFSGDSNRNEYDANIQIADLNALNAALAVVKWKKLFGFYQDLENEHSCTYTIGGNMLLNEDQQS